MQKHSPLSTITILILSILLTSCGQSNDTTQDADIPPQDADIPPQEPEANQIDTPQFQANITVNNLKYGSRDGGSSESTFAPTGKITYGYPGAVGEHTWKFLRHVDGKDVYFYKWRLPIDETPDPSEIPITVGGQKEIEYSGEETIILEHRYQTVTLTPIQENPSDLLPL